MDADRFLSLYQSVSLAKINALSKQNLIAQYAQCEQLTKLEKQLAESNEANRSILKNQITELKRQEKVRYYKSLVFNLSQALTKIESQVSADFKAFLASVYAGAIAAYAKDAVQNLEEIADKEYASKVADRAVSLSECKPPQGRKSIWEDYLERDQQYKSINPDAIEKSIAVLKNESNSVKSKTRKSWKLIAWNAFYVLALIFLIIMILAALITIFDKERKPGDLSAAAISVAFFACSFALGYYKRKKYKKVEQEKKTADNAQIEALQAELDALMTKKETQLQSMESLQSKMESDVPGWDSVVAEVANLLPAIKDCPDDSDSNLPFTPDERLLEAARLIVTSQKSTSGFIQSRMGIGYAKADRILSQLEQLKIISPKDGSNSRKVLVPDLVALNKILS